MVACTSRGGPRSPRILHHGWVGLLCSRCDPTTRSRLVRTGAGSTSERSASSRTAPGTSPCALGGAPPIRTVIVLMIDRTYLTICGDLSSTRSQTPVFLRSEGRPRRDLITHEARQTSIRPRNYGLDCSRWRILNLIEPVDGCRVILPVALYLELLLSIRKKEVYPYAN